MLIGLDEREISEIIESAKEIRLNKEDPYDSVTDLVRDIKRLAIEIVVDIDKYDVAENMEAGKRVRINSVAIDSLLKLFRKRSLKYTKGSD